MELLLPIGSANFPKHCRTAVVLPFSEAGLSMPCMLRSYGTSSKCCFSRSGSFNLLGVFAKMRRGSVDSPKGIDSEHGVNKIQDIT